MNRLALAAFCVLVFGSFVGCNNKSATAPPAAQPQGAAQSGGTPSADAPSYAYITNGVADFWKLAGAGANKAGEDLGVKVEVITPADVTDQTRRIEDLLTRGTDGIAISPISPKNQTDVLNKAAAQTNLITQDSDAPTSNRLFYIGLGNYEAGLLCGQTLRKAMLPEGGKVMIFVGRTDQDNAVHRRRGFIDGLLDRKSEPGVGYPINEESKSVDGKFIVLGTLTDEFDPGKAIANVEDTVTKNPDIAGMVGLFGYNPPLIIEGLKHTDHLGKVKVMGFDEDDATLQGVKDGSLVATVVQNPYEYGYQSVKLLNELHKGNKSVIPENKFIDIPARVIDQSNVGPFWDEVKLRLGKK